MPCESTRLVPPALKCNWRTTLHWRRRVMSTSELPLTIGTPTQPHSEAEELEEALVLDKSKPPAQWSLPVLEVFGPTIQGEGPIAGRVCHFVRLAICDWRCDWCDTKESWTAKYSTRKTFGEIAEEVAGHGPVDIITITGGNPCVHPLVDLLMAAIWRAMPHVQFSLETQGSIWQEWVRSIQWCVVSPKPPSSG